MNQDSFKRQTEELSAAKDGTAPQGTGRLQADTFERRGTGPIDSADGVVPAQDEANIELGPRRAGGSGRLPAVPRTGGTGRLLDEATLNALTESTHAKALGLVSGLEPRIELLLRGCQAAKLPVPGVEWGPFRHELTPNTAKIVAYLQRALLAREGLPRQVQVAVFRYFEAAQVVGQVGEAVASGAVSPGMLEELKLKSFYLTRFHEEFKADPVLKQMFPAPQPGAVTAALAGRSATAPLSPIDAQRQRQARDAMLQQAESYLQQIASRLQQIEGALALLEQSGKRDLKAFLSPATFSPAQRRARQQALKLGEDPGLVAQLRKGLKLHATLTNDLKELRRGQPVETFQETYELFSGLIQAWHQDERVRAYLVRDGGTGEISPEPG